MKIISKKSLLKLMNFWPPFLGAGIKVETISPDFRSIRVSMKLKFWNKNYVNTHYGGSLFSMTDPFYMLMLIENLGRDYIVWDKSANIRYKKPGTGKVYADFNLSESVIDDIKTALINDKKVETRFTILIKNTKEEIIAEVEKVLSIQLKKKTNSL